MKDTERNLIEAVAKGLMGFPIEIKRYATSGVYCSGTRVIALDFGQEDVGPMIGIAGSMKLAIQTLLACPFGGDACQIKVDSTRQIKQEGCAAIEDLDLRLQAILQAIAEHYPTGAFSYRVERSPSAFVVLITARGPAVDQIRGALAKLLRSVGRRHGAVVVVSIEIAEPAAA